MMEIKDNEVIGLKGIIVKYLLHWRLFLLVFILSFIPAVLYLVLYPRTYEMMARIQILEDKDVGGGSFGLGEAAGLMRSFGLGSMGSGTVNIEDELSTLTSNAMLRKMVRDLGVNVEYTKPYSFYRLYESNPYVLATDSLTDERLDEDIKFEVRFKAGEIRIRTESERHGKNNFRFSSLPAVVSLPNGDFTLAYAPGKERSVPENMNILFRPAGWVAEDLEEEFLIEEYSKTATIIELSCTDYEKSRGVDMLNRLIRFYNEDAGSFKTREAQRTLAYLDERIDSVTHSLLLVESEIAAYKNANMLTDIEHDVSFYVEQMRDIQITLIELESQSHLVEMMDEFVKNPDNKYNLVPILLSQGGEKGSPIMTYNEILVERARVIQNSDKNNPLALNLTKQADQLRESVFQSISNAQKATRKSIDDIKEKEKMLFAKMESFPDKERDFIKLKRQQEIFQGVYIILLQKKEETALNFDLDREKAKILDAAFAKSKPVAPRKLYAAIGMLFFTLFIPVVYLFCKEQLSALIKEYRKVKSRH
ncbi:MAG: tyrosine protein kinase [Tannerellaceae bacterium]|jgi:uncharacterized protein involved in exopolysaccharide biosynthesis|nr:tyrosine protein kinase [Tannerellaceae bacterium]